MYIWRYFALVCVSLLLIGCGSVEGVAPAANTNFGKKPSSAYKAQIKNTMNKTLKDPYSSKYTFDAAFRGYINHKETGNLFWKGYVVPFTLNAKNSYGGYTGEVEYYALFDSNGQIFAAEGVGLLPRLMKF